MKFLALASLLSLVAAQSSSEAATASSSASAASPSSSTSAYGSGLVSALNSAGLTTLAGLLQPLASDLVPIISEGNFTVFAPTNDALASVDTSNMTALAEILMYHIAYGQPNVTANNTIARTLLSGSQVNLGQNYTNQALVYNTNTTTGAVQVVGQNVTVSMNTTYQNLLVNVIDGVLSIPGPIPMELANPLGANATTLVTSLSAVAPDLLTLANTTAGLTVFAPVNSAVQAAAPALLSLSQSNSTAITDIVASHVLPAVVYSTNITCVSPLALKLYSSFEANACAFTAMV